MSHLLVFLDAGSALLAGERAAVLADPRVSALMQPPAAELGQLPAPAARPYELPAKGPLLQLRDVMRYGELSVLDKVNWVLGREDHCCVSGPNGCSRPPC